MSPVEKIQQSIQSLKGQFDKIEVGPSCNYYGDGDIASAVKELEKLGYQSSLNTPEVGQRWNLAILMNEVVVRIIFDAEDWGGKLVNGPMGEWCPKAGKSLETFWSKLLKTTSTNHNNIIIF